jgi:DnaK suppressor protein
MDRERARELLRRERERIEKALASQAGSRGGELNDPAEQATAFYIDELSAAVHQRLAEELAAVERAERRLAAGTYGLSIESGKPIPDERLEAIPTAERTADEQAQIER